MPRIARAVCVDLPHHVTQRGNNQQKVFKRKNDHAFYISLMRKYSKILKLQIWSYCLMPNHVHFIVVPREPDSMAKTFDVVHMLYSQYFNSKMNRKGHLWQSRFYSCLLDNDHLCAAARYIERNPVRARIVDRPEEYRWSSAYAHINKTPDRLLSGDCFLTHEITDWKKFLTHPDDEKILEKLRSRTRSGRPAGNDDFITNIENKLGRSFNTRPKGRPRKPQ